MFPKKKKKFIDKTQSFISYPFSSIPGYRQFENEVITMTASFLNGDSETVGSITSGGTESILMAMKAYRDRARQYWPQIKDPEMVKITP